MLFTDLLTFDKPRRTSDNYLVVRAKAARTGVYAYTGSEIDPENTHGLRDKASVNVLRDEGTVFDKKAVHSFIGKPITNDHPTVAVSAENWRDHARGVVMGAVRDGEHLSFDLLLTDATAIADVEGGKRELSNGYGAELEFGDFTAADGTKCEARQASIKGNHVAIVDRGRAGSECRIGDAVRCSSLPADVFELLTDERTYSDGSPAHKTDGSRPKLPDGETKMPHTLIIDGLQVTEVSDQAKAAIEKLQGQVTAITADKAASDTKVGELTATVSTKDGEIAALNQKLKDAEVSPAKLEQLAADRAALVASVKALDANIVTDGKSEAEIRKAVVAARLGDAAKDMDDAAISGAFKVLTSDVKVDPVRNALSGGVVNVGDEKAAYEKARDEARKNLSDAWRAPAAVAAA
jgi:hypothetical protein